ncbi:hypothetical protein LSTR_LSTR013436 [Laodelphax striatellus]|uniref:FLYWCH-type domain-containing protein n=1 Tax=Laodelphax striatellus TaxID=195883 RepID=A0A482X0G0_LAOST|nr:hypothetical protein LSTR_LSTR013436 [Laodelphax striatellus]
MEKFILGLTNKGNPKLTFNNFDYRKSSSRVNGNITWRCLNKRCRAHLITDKNSKMILDILGSSDHSHPAPLRQSKDNSAETQIFCSTPSILTNNTDPLPDSDSLNGVNSDDSLNDMEVASKSNDGICGCSSLIEKLITENNVLKADNIRLKEQWDVAIDRSISNDVRIMELTDCLTKECKEFGMQTDTVLFDEIAGAPSFLPDEQVKHANDTTLPFGLDVDNLHLLIEENCSLMDQVIAVGEELEKAKKALVFERAAHIQFNTFFENSSLFCKSQFGFRKGRSIEDAVFEINKETLKARDDSEKALGVFCDLSGAFDNVQHDLLLLKLRHYGVNGKAFSWFSRI